MVNKVVYIYKIAGVKHNGLPIAT